MLSSRFDSLEKMLSRMEVGDRQKYAADNMDDPIAVLTALYVNNEDKKKKLSRQGVSEIKNPVVPQAIQAMTQPDIPPQGPPQGMPQGPQQGPPQGGPQQGPPQGMPPQGMPPQGMPPQGPPQGMPPPQGQPRMAADGGYMDSRLPEEMGIGALPERSLSNMADGGIVGFNEGGDVQRFQVGGSAKERLPGESFAAFRARMFQLELKNAQERNEAEEPAREAERQRRVAQMQAERGGEIIPSSPFRDPSAPLAFAPPPSAAPPVGPPSAAPNAAPSVATMPTDATRRGDARFPVAGPLAGAGPAAPPADAAPRPAAPPAVRSTAGAGAGTAPAQQQEDYGALFNRIRSGLPDARVSMPKEFKEMGDLREAQANNEIVSEEGAKAGLASLLGKRETRIGEREKRLADKSSNDINMALIDAGLSMMQSVKPGFAGIAEGLTTGAKRYAEESRLTETARQKIEDARDAHDDLKFNREDMSRKQILAAQGKLVDAKVAVKKDVVDYLAREKDISTKVAGHVFDAKVAQILEGQKQKFQTGENVLNRANILSAAGISSGAGLKNQLGLLEALGGAAPDSAVAKGFKMQKQEAQEPMLFKVYTDAQKDPLNGDKFKTQYPDFASFLADFNKRSGFSALPGSAATPTAPVVLPR